MYPGIRKSGMAAPVYEAITDTLTLPQAPAPDHTRFVKKGRTESETNFYSGTVATSCSAPPATRDTSTRPILGPVNP